MWTNRFRQLGLVVLAVAAAGFLMLLLHLLAVQLPRWRASTVYRALKQSNEPALWWPPAWRDELARSILLEGQVKNPNEGTLELASIPEGPVFRTAVSNGRYTFHPRVLPAGAYKVRLLRPDGTSTSWLPTGTLDPGSHRLDFVFK
jgi:hypothetical protein